MASFHGLQTIVEVMSEEQEERDVKSGVCEKCGDILEPDSDSDYCRPCLGWAHQDAYWTKAEQNERD